MNSGDCGKHGLPKITKKGEMGVGMLLLFIASILVTAVAASVLILTTTDFQGKILSTGKEVRQEVSTHVNVIDISGHDGRDGELANLSIIMRLASGSDQLNLEDALLVLSLPDDTRKYRYNATANISDPNSVAYHYPVSYDSTGSEHRAGLLSQGDVIEIHLVPPRPLVPDESIRIVYTPKSGTQTTLDFRTPDVISKEEIQIYP